MFWIAAGVVLVILVIILMALFFRSSGALNIAEEEQEEISHESPEQIAEEVRQIEREDAEAEKAAGRAPYTSHGQDQDQEN